MNWLLLPKFTEEYSKGAQDFVLNGFANFVVLHPTKCADNIHYEYNVANFDMTKKEKENFCSVLKNARLPYGSASNISRCVHMDERKVFRYKSHDAHFILQYFLQFIVIKTLKPEVAIPLIRLGAFFRGICGKVINLEDVHKLQEEIIEILCELKTIFPPIHLRWMFGIERYLCKLKSYVRNKSKPGWSMAEGYLAEECLTFCSRFLSDEVKKKEEEQKFNVSYSIGSRRNKDGKPVDLADKVWTDAHRYILFNCGNMEIEKLIEEHHTMNDNGKDDLPKQQVPVTLIEAEEGSDEEYSE
ncbi:hypothetical protein POM88_028708 [Heracleum sosnowskyi]|uniref:DUF4218 domain-containing protein n=1 Tax=Heracleum sosnowskyi TaxID=360622 RepID=A0AAD8HSJ7_9APIA|nr:hypothetical protein POM88_028708 [Heracleum sosnowskyi]